MKNSVKIAVIFILGLILGLGAGLFVSNNKFSAEVFQNTSPSKTIEASLMIDFSDGRIITCNKKQLGEEKTAFKLLQICSENAENPFELKYENYPELGALINQIGERKSGEEGKYWQYWVNNEYAQIGASQFLLKDKDIVEWKFIK